ncbi:MAG: O-antigen ligase family protein [Acidobacteriota bacterium]|nr:O-antigen ligase family protein [Acidobacteriota bacterium]
MNTDADHRSPGTIFRIALFLAAGAAGALLLSAGFPPGSPDRLPVLLVSVALALFTAARPARGVVLFAFLFPWAGLLARVCGGRDPVTWPGLLLCGLAAGWTFRFIYDFESRPDRSRADPALRALLAVWTLGAVLACVRAWTLWALVRGLLGRAVNGEGLAASVAVRESLFAYAALAGGAAFYFLLRRAGDTVRRRAVTAALWGVGVSSAAALLQAGGILPAEVRPYWRLTERLSGGAVDPNSLGLLSALLLLVAAGGALGRGRARLLSAFFAILLVAGLVVSGSRSGVLLAGGAAAVLLFARAVARPVGRKVAVGALVLLLAAAALVFVRGAGSLGNRLRQTFDPGLPLEYRVSARPLLWRAAGRLFLRHPVEGAGVGAFAWTLPDLLREDGRTVPMRDNPGSGYVQAAAETGLVGALITLAAVLALASQAWRRARGDQTDLPAAAAGAAVLGFLAALAAGSHWLAPDVSLLFFLLAAASALPAGAAEGRAARRLRLWAVVVYAAAAFVGMLATFDADEAFRHAARIGFYDRESGPGGVFRWTRRHFALRVWPGENVRLGLANFSADGKPITAVARARGAELYRATFAAGQARALRISAGSRPVAIVFTLDRSFVPRSLGASGDRRRLGLLSTSSLESSP